MATPFISCVEMSSVVSGRRLRLTRQQTDEGWSPSFLPWKGKTTGPESDPIKNHGTANERERLSELLTNPKRPTKNAGEGCDKRAAKSCWWRPFQDGSGNPGRQTWIAPHHTKYMYVYGHFGIPAPVFSNTQRFRRITRPHCA